MIAARGKLKIFFGYSAGAGKTYAMLKAAQEEKSAGVDVVIGYLEPHDRPETLKMAEGLEVLPLKKIQYRGITLNEFDVDAAERRRPKLLLVDELAHTNAPDCKNRKRYLDIEEVLNCGIDVYTTVNVQHIEGLHDLVDSATSVDVNERIPDEIFDYADEVVLVDIEPDALIERMREGKIYPKTRAKAALENFFRADNLSSLRELFMRRSADRIEKQVNHGERRTRILVLISPSPSSQKTIRVAARTAEAFHCKFSAMYVETNGALSDEAAANLKKHMNLVRDTGGEIIVKYSDDVVETVADYVRLAGVTHLILGKTWQSAGKKVGLEDKFIERLPNLEILIVPDNQRFYAKRAYRQTLFARLFNRNKLLQKYKTANRILDIAHLLERASLEESEKNKRQVQIAHILSRAFDRSVAILSVKGKSTAAVKGENVGFFGEGNETAVAEWCRKNHKAAGRGTDTLRESKAIYFPVTMNTETVVVAFSCMERKLTVTERLIFYQLENLLRMIL